MLSFSVNPPQTKVVKFKLNSEVKDVKVVDNKTITLTVDDKTLTIYIDKDSVTLTSSNQLSAETHYKFNLEDY